MQFNVVLCGVIAVPQALFTLLDFFGQSLIILYNLKRFHKSLDTSDWTAHAGFEGDVIVKMSLCL